WQISPRPKSEHSVAGGVSSRSDDPLPWAGRGGYRGWTRRRPVSAWGARRYSKRAPPEVLLPLETPAAPTPKARKQKGPAALWLRGRSKLGNNRAGLGAPMCVFGRKRKKPRPKPGRGASLRQEFTGSWMDTNNNSSAAARTSRSQREVLLLRKGAM